MFKVRVPASTANMGPGFDSIGMALNLYNYVEIEENDNSDMSLYEGNLIYETIKYFYKCVDKKLPQFKMTQIDNIPFTRGLGSSSACIVAGLLIGNQLSKSNLTKKDLGSIAIELEGHPDNVIPTIFGGMVVTAINGSDYKFTKITEVDELDFTAIIPEFKLSTNKARKALPERIPREDAVFNISRVALLIGSVKSRDYDNLLVAMEDCIHEPYRIKFIPNMGDIFKKASSLGAKGVFLSGAGPTLMAVNHKNDNFTSIMSDYLDSLSDKWTIKELKADLVGATIL